MRGASCVPFPDTAERQSEARATYVRMYFQLRGLPSAIHATAVSSRRCRVSSVLASTIHSMYSRLWLGGNAPNAARALALRRSAATRAAGVSSGGFVPRGVRAIFTPLSFSRAAWRMVVRSARSEGRSSTDSRSEEHTSELQSLAYLVCRL